MLNPQIISTSIFALFFSIDFIIASGDLVTIDHEIDDEIAKEKLRLMFKLQKMCYE